MFSLKKINFFFGFLVTLWGIGLLIATLWIHFNFGKVELEQIILNLLQPLQGVAKGLMYSGISLIFFLSLILAVFVVYILKNYIPKYALLILYVFGFSLMSIPFIQWDLIFFIRSRITDSLIYEQEHNVSSIKTNGRNIIYIVLESFEKSYQNKDVLGQNLAPQLTQIQNKNTTFYGFHQLKQTGWTITSLMSSFCGVPLKFDNLLTDIYLYQHFIPGLNCWPEQLKQQGYNTVLMKASSIRFTGTDKFALQHGFQKAIGEAELKEKFGDGDNSNWGLNDHAFFQAVKAELTQLSKQNKPFLLATVQADTHQPRGHVNKKCDVIYDDYRDAVICTDQEAFALLKWIKEQPFYENTTIVIAGDHLVSYTDIDDKLEQMKNREIFFTVINPGTQKQPQQHRFTNLDVAPTILDAAGFEFDGKFGLGQSLYREEKTLFEKQGQKLEFELACRSEKYRSWGNTQPVDVFFEPKRLIAIKQNELIALYKDIHTKLGVKNLKQYLFDEYWTQENVAELKFKPENTQKEFKALFTLVTVMSGATKKNMNVYWKDKKIAVWEFKKTQEIKKELVITPEMIEEGIVHLRFETEIENAYDHAYTGTQFVDMTLLPLGNS